MKRNFFINKDGTVNTSEKLQEEIFSIDIENIEKQLAEQPILHSMLGVIYAQIERKITLDKIHNDNHISDIKLQMESHKSSLIEMLKNTVDSNTGKKLYTEKQIDGALKSDPTISNYLKEINILASSQVEEEYALTLLKIWLKASEQRHACLITLGGLQRSERDAE